ncbi:hypothetical protein [[Actinomadura] parvosata]|nr:hypothetical protein [Nonomuraea sp. ATCC 55076]
MDAALLAGIFALFGVALQQTFSLLSARITQQQLINQGRRQEHRELYGRYLAQARRVQRLLKELSRSPAVQNEDGRERASAELDILAEITAEIRLVAPGKVAAAVVDLEDSMRRHLRDGGDLPDGLPLGPVITILSADLAHM